MERREVVVKARMLRDDIVKLFVAAIHTDTDISPDPDGTLNAVLEALNELLTKEREHAERERFSKQ